MFKRILVDLVLIIAGLFVVYIGLCFYLYFKQDDYIFFPEKTITATPRTFGMKYEENFIKTEDNLKINVWFIPKENAPLIIHCNGNGGNLSDRAFKFSLLNSLGFAVVGFDYRGYGKSEGKPSEDGFYKDLRSVVSFCENKGYKKKGIILYGESIGGAVALQVATENNFAALVLESTFTSLNDMARVYYKLFPTSILLKSNFDNISKIDKIHFPIVIMHSKEDEIVPYYMGKSLFEKANEPKIFLELSKGHNDGGIAVSPDAAEELKTFLEKFARIEDY